MAATKKPATKQTTKRAPAKKAVAKRAPAKKASTKKAPPKKAAAKKTPAAKTVAKKAPARNARVAHESASDLLGIPAPRGKTKDGIAYTKDFDVRFLKSQHLRLIAERDTLLGQASRLEDEANSLIEDGEMGDVQFDDESGEGDTMVVERERDLALSAQARQTIADIDAALARMGNGTYGYSVVSGRPIPRERLEAIPWATVLVEEKVGGIGRR
jgi:RNA polymerase-binding transcription factor